MLTVIASWLASKGVSLILGFVAHLIVDGWKAYIAADGQRDAGRAEVEAAQANLARETQEEIAKEAAKTVTEDDALARMEKGEA